jgi:hypothetical protein
MMAQNNSLDKNKIVRALQKYVLTREFTRGKVGASTKRERHMKNFEPYVIPEMKARIDNQYGVAFDNVFGCDIPVLVEFEYDRDEDEPPQVRQMVVKAAQDFVLGSDFFDLVVKQGADITDMLDVSDESAIMDELHKRMAARAVDDNEAMRLHLAGV